MNTASAIDKNAIARRLLLLYSFFGGRSFIRCIGKRSLAFLQQIFPDAITGGIFFIRRTGKGLIKWIIPLFFHGRVMCCY